MKYSAHLTRAAGMLAALSLLTPLSTAQPERTVVRPADTGAALVNPGMGWMFHHYDNDITRYTVELAPADTVEEFPGASSVYLRLPWSYLEPEEGKFNWAIVDGPMQKWTARGKTVAFRFSTSEGRASEAYATPRWVEQAGARGYHLANGRITHDGAVWEPDFEDAVYLGKLDRFLAAAAARYDGNPDVAFIDVGSFGVWGEGHTAASTKLPYSAGTSTSTRSTSGVRCWWPTTTSRCRGGGWRRSDTRATRVWACATTASWCKAAKGPTTTPTWRTTSGRGCR